MLDPFGATYLKKIRFELKTKPALQLKGGVTITAGPTIAGVAAVSVDGDLTLHARRPGDPARRRPRQRGQHPAGQRVLRAAHERLRRLRRPPRLRVRRLQGDGQRERLAVQVGLQRRCRREHLPRRPRLRGRRRRVLQRRLRGLRQDADRGLRRRLQVGQERGHHVQRLRHRALQGRRPPPRRRAARGP